MLNFLNSFAEKKIFKRLEALVSIVNTYEKELENISLAGLIEKSEALKRRIKEGETTDQILPEAFALVREASKRTLSKRHFDVQIMGGVVLHEGKIAEMKTGEGKTLAATLPAYLNAISIPQNSGGVHIVTVNDYLAKRDTVWMGQIYNALGLSVACVVHNGAYLYDPEYTKEKLETQNLKYETNLKLEIGNEEKELDKQRDELGSFMVFEEFLRPVPRKEAYEADIIYGTNHEFGFDFLRDNLLLQMSDKVQKSLEFAIIDEVDSILIDEARTPLIIASPDRESSELYKTFAKIVSLLKNEDDYVVDEKLKAVNITESGIEKVEREIGVSNMFDPENARFVHYLQESLKAKELFKKDRDYVVRNGEIVIVDEFTGRMLFGRRYSGGLHQAIEAKDGVFVKEENRTYAQITIQNYFRLYKKIAGMTGTAQTSGEEFHKVYNLDVVSIPTNKPMIREDLPDEIYRTKEEKYMAVISEIKKRNEKGQSILIGTTSIANNEIISSYLSKEGITHEVLNAKNNEREGSIIAQAGRLGAVTVATNMAGRGVDIIFGGNPPTPEEAEKVKSLGGLHVIGMERHEARRIDDQLRGRAGRQGDPGSSQFFLSLEDDLLRIFGGERIQNIMNAVNFPKDTPISSGVVSKAVNQAQQRVEGNNFDIRKHLLEYDDVLNRQRSALYEKRKTFLSAGESGEIMPVVKDILENTIARAEQFIESSRDAEPVENIQKKETEILEMKERVGKIPSVVERERSALIGKHLTRIFDMLWIEHLENLDSLRSSVNIRAYGQRDPLIEYRKEARFLFSRLNENFEGIVLQTIFSILGADIRNIKEQKKKEEENKKRMEVAGRGNLDKKVGRNDPCPCGAKDPKTGKPIKYKKCHGK